MKRLGTIPKRVRVTNISEVPPMYFLRPRVLRAVRKEVMADLNGGLRRTPAGIHVSWSYPGFFPVVWSYIKQALSAAKGAVWRKKSNTK